jgi:hypothetical protein
MEIYGQVLEKTPDREWYVATRMIQKWLDSGMTEAQIALRWNAGGATRCSAGTNKYGVEYDSCAYQKKILALLR